MNLPPGITLRGLFAIAGLAMLAVLSYGLLRWVTADLEAPPALASQAPLLIVENFRAARLNAHGQHHVVVEAPRLAQYPDPLGTRIEQPILNWYDAAGTTLVWHVQSQSAWVSADQETLRLEGAVTMQRTAESGKSPMLITSRDVLVHPNQQYVETAAFTEAIIPGGKFASVGVRAWLDQERLELSSKVRGTYAAPQR